ncbi:MAG: glycogen debranching protein GlgX [Deltaproteobacteria bacterium]|nr:glycogen debranching protein GlgX [Deltaproteobacteria bacterium]
MTPEGVNFSVFSRHATSLTLVLFEKDRPRSIAEIPFDPEINRTGDIWHILVLDMDPSVRYGYKADGLFDPKGKGHRFKQKKILLDPYAQALEGGETWEGQLGKGFKACSATSFRRRCMIVEHDFEWEGDRPLNLPLKDSVIYELHVRGYTVHGSSEVTSRGTYKGLIEKIPYIKSLGVTAVELMPVFEFNELENKKLNPKTGERLKNFWGYNTLGFFAPKASYASKGWDGNQVKEFKEMVKAFHCAGLEVIIDVVFNHTAESNSGGPVISFRGLDNTVYYALDPESKEYLNLAGCGNTVNCNHPVVQTLILDCLRYWVVEMHVDGFRFDLASILRRDYKGEFLSGPSLIDAIEQDPVLAHSKIIAEAWDTQTNQVGAFPGRWAEWNSYYRDDVRRFGRGEPGMVPMLATRIGGSSDLYQTSGRRPYNSINYITCHDGFTLYDLVSYDRKHNEENGEDNQDGTDQNFSSNGGVEGPAESSLVNDLRLRRMKTLVTILMVSHGVPMILAGDEFGRTQQGNNNPYCQDNETSWVNWNLAEENVGLLRFFRKVIALRSRHPVFRRSHFLTGKDTNLDKRPDVSWHGLELDKPDWSENSKVLAFMLDGHELPHEKRDDDFCVILNGDQVEHSFEVPPPKAGKAWFRIIDTGMASPEDILDEDQGIAVIPERKCSVLPMAAVVFISFNTPATPTT